MSNAKEIVLDRVRQLEPAAVWSLASITTDGRPWVRYVTPQVVDDDLVIWGNTFAHSRKVAQIAANPEVHLTVGVKDMASASSYLQVEARAELLTDPQVKTAVWADYMKAVYSGPDDPNYVVLKIIPYRIELQTLAPKPPVVWERE